MNPAALGLGYRATNKSKKKKIKLKFMHQYFSVDPITNLIDLSSPGTHRTDMTQSDIGEKKIYKNRFFKTENISRNPKTTFITDSITSTIT
jgi:hypothetical protein